MLETREEPDREMNHHQLAEHLRYHRWATLRMLDAAKQLAEEEVQRDRAVSHGSVLGTLLHVYQADRVWLARVRGEPPVGLEPDANTPATVDVLRNEWAKLCERWLAWAEGLSANATGEDISYCTTKGVPYTDPRWRIVLHLVNHGAYHRGQVAAMLRQCGRVPPATDLIAFYRLGGNDR
jgi:uncharacterized damage-inducible protein DinB